MKTLPNTTPPAAFTAWQRTTKRDRWAPVAEGDDAAAALDAALRAPGKQHFCDLVVLAAGADPNTTPRRTAGRRRL